VRVTASNTGSSLPRHLQTNGMVERVNGRIAEVLATTRFDSAQNLADTLTGDVR
jgi:hypothetical protein